MTDYLSTQKAAERWGISERRVNQLCAQGRILGAVKFGKSWAIPIDAEKPDDPRRLRSSGSEKSLVQELLANFTLMPLMNTSFRPGECRLTAESMEPGLRRDIAMAEYHYFSGQPEAASLEAERYLKAEIQGPDCPRA